MPQIGRGEETAPWTNALRDPSLAHVQMFVTEWQQDLEIEFNCISKDQISDVDIHLPNENVLKQLLNEEAVLEYETKSGGKWYNQMAY